MSKSFLIDEAKNTGMAKAMTKLFNEVYQKMVKAECRFISVALLILASGKLNKNVNCRWNRYA